MIIPMRSEPAAPASDDTRDHPFKVGDLVRALQNRVHVPVGAIGKIAMFSSIGENPIVDFPNPGRVVIRADCLALHDGPVPNSRPRPDRIPLAAELRARAPEVPLTLPPLDWFEHPPEDDTDPATLEDEAG
jgi:hypothetical protein